VTLFSVLTQNIHTRSKKQDRKGVLFLVHWPIKTVIYPTLSRSLLHWSNPRAFFASYVIIAIWSEVIVAKKCFKTISFFMFTLLIKNAFQQWKLRVPIFEQQWPQSCRLPIPVGKMLPTTDRRKHGQAHRVFFAYIATKIGEWLKSWWENF
jgi:hypothetical protein